MKGMIHSMDTDYYKCKNIECFNELIDKYNLQLRLDDFGMGTEIYYNDNLVGYWFQYEKGIELHCTNMYGGEVLRCESWEDLCEGIEKIIAT